VGIAIPLPRDDIAAFCRRHHIRRLAIFGSATRPDFGPASDVDVWVEFEPGRTPGLAFFSLQAELSAMLGRAVDLQTPAWLGPRIAASVERDLDVVYDAA
jgi:uncharacterized protein